MILTGYCRAKAFQTEKSTGCRIDFRRDLADEAARMLRCPFRQNAGNRENQLLGTCSFLPRLGA
jgi:hypothetical protein